MTLQQLFTAQLQDLYDAEQQLLAGLTQMAQAARGSALRAAFTSHLEQTRLHVQRLKDAFTLIGATPSGRHCAGIAGILEEGRRLIQHETIDGAVLDAGLIASAQKAEHYEMCSYGTCIAWARTLGLHQVAARLEETLVEEKAADQALNDLAMQDVNISASHEPT